MKSGIVLVLSCLSPTGLPFAHSKFPHSKCVFLSEELAPPSCTHLSTMLVQKFSQHPMQPMQFIAKRCTNSKSCFRILKDISVSIRKVLPGVNEHSVRYFSLHLSFLTSFPFPSNLSISLSFISINLHSPLRLFFTVVETRCHHSCLQQPGKLSSPPLLFTSSP